MLGGRGPTDWGRTDMRYIVYVIDDQSRSGTSAEMAAVDEFNDRLLSEGHWVMAAGIGAPSTAIVIDNREGNEKVTYGSVFASNEFYSGFWIIDAPDQGVALRLANEGSRCCNRRVELRPLL